MWIIAERISSLFYRWQSSEWKNELRDKKCDDKSSHSRCSSSPWKYLQMLFICLSFLSHLILSDLLGLEPIGRFFYASTRRSDLPPPPGGHMNGDTTLPPLSFRLHHCLKTTVTLLLCPMIIIVSHCYFESAFFMYQCVPYLRRGSHQFFIVFLLFFWHLWCHYINIYK